MLNKLIITIFFALLLSFTGLNTSMAGPAFGGGCGGKGLCKDQLDQPSAGEIEWLEYMREEEKLARDSYILMNEEHGLIIFANIARSEQLHMDAVKTLFDKYGLEDPVIDEIGEFSNPVLSELFDEFMERGLDDDPMVGLQVGGEIEETDMRDIKAAIDATSKADIISTYENLLCGSGNHLRAYVKQIEILGGEYERIILTEEELAEVVGPPVARKCGSNQ
jgi:hypothetical protein